MRMTDSTDGGSTLREERQSREDTLHSIDSIRQLLHVTRELLSQRQWRSILTRKSVESISERGRDKLEDEFDQF